MGKAAEEREQMIETLDAMRKDAEWQARTRRQNQQDDWETSLYDRRAKALTAAIASLGKPSVVGTPREDQ